MKLTVHRAELIEIFQQVMDEQVDDCEHVGFDPCCVICQAKRICLAEYEDELEVIER